MAHKQIRLPENTQNTYHYRANVVRKMRYSTGDSYLSLFLSYSESIGSLSALLAAMTALELIFCHSVVHLGRVALMDKASDFESEDCVFEFRRSFYVRLLTA